MPTQRQKKSPGSLFCPHEPSRRTQKTSGTPFSVSELSGFKGVSLIACLIHPHRVHNAHPDVCQSTQSHAVGFALRQFALVVGSRPGFRERRLPGKLREIIAPWLHTGKALVCSGVIATLERHWSGPSEFLDAAGIRIACASITPFSKQARSQAFARARKRAPDVMLFLGQKKGLDLLLVGSNVLHHH